MGNEKLIIETSALSYAFRKHEPILSGLDIAVPQGSIYGFLGPNGAGKTTTLRLVLALLRNQKGVIRLFEKDITAHRLSILKRTGSLIEQPSLYGHLSGKENLEIYRRHYGCSRSRIGEVLDLVRLTQAAGKKAKAYSLGMKQRLAIAISLLHDPELLVLDEPTNGLDPNGIIEIRELLRTLNRDFGKTILVSSHLLAEIEKIATHVGIIHKGSLLFQGTLQQLQELKTRQSVIELEVSDPVAARQILEQHFPVREIKGRKLLIEYESRNTTALINKALVSAGLDVFQLFIAQNDLESLFLQITAEDGQPVETKSLVPKQPII